MGNFLDDFLTLRADYPANRECTIDWVKWMRKEGRKRRLHGGLLDHAILDLVEEF